ncbi:Thermosome subunit alpha [Candidatus Lokiarchaeum ossiferum]|uniref:Thermosome subunit alpha n=1 Tax=Candidatus Lokiarchaeum ossiferum TaxID=2951803 RepID=A0ABY6HW68_9ARCH|nr:Thermosome subunit alpha [Candidatus Lokiarchaeum sp. B-35]
MLGGTPILILREGSERSQGNDARAKNILAIQAVAEAVKSTLGPRGMDKMLVDSLGDITVTNDGATILDNLDVQHPGAKMAVAISKSQDENVGDGTTSSVIIAGQLLTVANELMSQGIHPSVVSRGFNLAGKTAREVLKEIAMKIDPDTDKEILKKIAITTMNSKGISGNKEFFAELAVEAFAKVKSDKNNMRQVKDIMIVKKKGKSLKESEIIDGIILEKEATHQMMPKVVHDAKIALVAQSFEIKKTEFSTDLRIADPSQIQGFLDQEESILKNFATKLKAIGANVIINQKGIDDGASHFLQKEGIVAIKSVTKTDLSKLQKAIGGKIIENIEAMTPSDLGTAKVVEFKKVAGDDLCFISGCNHAKAVSMLLRAGVSQGLDEAERTMHDALCVVASIYDRSAVVGGGGAVEMELSQRLLNIASKQTGKEQIAIETFARALEIIPITLSENAGLDPINIIAELRTAHSKPGNEFYGLEIYQGKVIDNREAGVIEPVANIDNIIKSATELAVMILRIDDMIKAKASAGGPPGGMGGMGGGMPPGMM